MTKQIITFKCPFCKDAEITAVYFPPVPQRRKGPWGGHKPDLSWSAESLIIQIKRCPTCGKAANEIKKAYLKGDAKKMSHKDRIRRLREAGLSTVIESKSVGES